MKDPYAGIAKPVAADPYAGIATRTKTKSKRPVAEDVARGFAGGLLSGVSGALETAGAALLAGSPARGLVGAAAGALDRAVPAAGLLRPTRAADAARSSMELRPETRAGRYAEKVGEFAPSAAMPGGLLRRAAQVVVPAVASEAAREVASAAGVGRGGQAAASVAGGLLGGAATGLRAPVIRPRPKPEAVVERLRNQKTAAYRKAEAIGARYTPKAFDEMVDGLEVEAAKLRLNERRNPKAASMLDEIRSMRGQSPDLTDLDQLRQVIARDVAAAPDRSERLFGNVMMRKLDEMIAGAGPDQMAVGAGDEAAAAISRARNANTRYRKAEAVSNGVAEAQLRTGSTYTGGNIDNALRQQMRRVLTKTANFTPAEREALESIVMGDRGQNLLRQAGRLGPQGNGLMLSVHGLGALSSGGATLPLTAAGGAARVAADAITKQKIAGLLELIEAGGQRAPEAERQLRTILTDYARRSAVPTAAGGLLATNAATE